MIFWLGKNSKISLEGRLLFYAKRFKNSMFLTEKVIESVGRKCKGFLVENYFFKFR